jgi:hypothetical protein
MRETLQVYILLCFINVYQVLRRHISYKAAFSIHNLFTKVIPRSYLENIKGADNLESDRKRDDTNINKTGNVSVT